MTTLTPGLPARAMYCGRAFQEAALAAQALNGDLWVASAGLGLIHADTPIPAYSATVSPGQADSVPLAPSRWFAELQARSPYAGWPALGERVLVLAALSAPYLAMLGPWLVSFAQNQPGSLRLFTRAGAAAIPIELRPYRMPYDTRLEDDTLGRAGTVGDFAQRALRDFAQSVLPENPEAGAPQHAAAVIARLRGRMAPSRPMRRSATDDEVRALIRAHWTHVLGRSTRMLRVLRDDLGVACEQGRFRDLFLEVAAERKGVRL
ncbi:hypothetical protein QSG27_05685 [Azospirillum sp. C340-1]|uniref:Uncharacterized protein n=1 Tax=Azospirillum isscasi TaxID=3053926 RepID=A0ABU0WDB5_9PROT|nr:hypothetical protein [Azospirillum isscasi]